MVEIIARPLVETQGDDNPEIMSLAERLKICREERGWTKAELRRRAGLKSHSTLTELESGAISDSPQLGAIAYALGIKIMWLQHGKGAKYEGDDPVVDLGTIALDAARIIDSLPKPLQAKALEHVMAMKEMHDLDVRVSALRTEQKKPGKPHGPDSDCP